MILKVKLLLLISALVFVASIVSIEILIPELRMSSDSLGFLTLLFSILVPIFLFDSKSAFSPINLYLVFYIFYYLYGIIYSCFNFPYLFSQDAILISNMSFIFGAVGIRVSTFLFRKSEPISSVSILRVKIFLDITMLLSVIIAIVWWGRVGGIPIFSSDVEYARVELAEGTFFHRQMISLFVPFYLIYLYVVSEEKRKFKDLRVIIYFLVGSFLLISQGYRTFMLSFWIISFLVYSDNVKFKIHSFKTLILTLFIFIFVFAFGLFRFFSSDENMNDDRDSVEVLYNTFLVRPQAIDDISQVFPQKVPYQYLSTYLRGMNFILPIYDKGLGLWLKDDVLYKDFAGAGYNPGIVGEFILAFGNTYVLFFMFLYGILVGGVSLWKYSNISPVNSIIRYSLLFYIVLAISPGLSTSLFSISWMLFWTYASGVLMKVKIR